MSSIETATCKNCGKKIVKNAQGRWQHAYGQQKDTAEKAVTYYDAGNGKRVTIPED